MNVRRRALLLLLAAGAVMLARAVSGQPTAPGAHRIGFLGSETALGYATRVEALRAGIRAAGYVEGQTIYIEWRWANGDYQRLPGLAAELVALQVDVIVADGAKASIAARNATASIPIVMAGVSDPVALGLVASLGRPGGNITGSTNFSQDISGKRLQLLVEVMPRITRVAVLLNTANAARDSLLEAMTQAAKTLKIELLPVHVREPGQLAGAFAMISHARAEAVVIQDDTLFNANAKAIAQMAAR